MMNDIDVDTDPRVEFLLAEGADANKEPDPETSMESPLMPIIDEEKILKAKSF